MENNQRPKVFNLEEDTLKNKPKDSFGGMVNLDPNLIEQANQTSIEINQAVEREGKYFRELENPIEVESLNKMRELRESERQKFNNGEKIIRPELSEANLVAHKTAVVTPISKIEKEKSYIDSEIEELNSIDDQIKKLEELKKKALLNKSHIIENSEEIALGGFTDEEDPIGYMTPKTEEPTILDEPKWDDPYDTLPLPSRGKIYKGKEQYIKVAYMTTEDEDLLSSPNMLRNPDFLKILFNRKILSNKIRYEDLHIGDRNAIMLWLRSTAYGSEYPVTFMNPNKEGETFDAVIDLSSLPIKYLDEVDTDDNGYFTFLTQNKDEIKFKFLNLLDLDEVERNNKEDNGKNISFFLNKIIVSINGSTDTNYISNYISKMRTLDSRKLREFYNNIESGVDLRLHVAIPGGGSLETFLPFTTKFFWPD